MGNRKTIWIIDHYSSEPKYGGISRQYDFARELDKRGYNVVIFSSGFSHYTHSYISEKEMFISKASQHVRYVYLKTHAYQDHSGKDRAINMFSFMTQVLRYYKKVAKHYGKPDVVEGASVHPLAWIAAYRIAKHFKVRFIAEVRDFWPQYWIDSGEMTARHPMAIFFQAIENFTFKHADHIIYSLYHGDKYICDEKGIKKEKTTRIGQPMDCDRYDLNRNKIDLLPTNIREFISNGFICTFTGYYMEYEGVYVMLEAQKLLQEEGIPVKMLFVGSGQEKSDMEKYILSNNIKNVLVGDRIEKDAVPALLSNSNACMAHIETKGHENVFRYGISKNKINDYLYSGVCTLFGFRFKDNEVTDSGGGLQYEPYNARDLADRIKYLYGQSDEERRVYGIKAMNYMKSHHNVKELSELLVKALFNE